VGGCVDGEKAKDCLSVETALPTLRHTDVGLLRCTWFVGCSSKHHVIVHVTTRTIVQCHVATANLCNGGLGTVLPGVVVVWFDSAVSTAHRSAALPRMVSPRERSRNAYGKGEAHVKARTSQIHQVVHHRDDTWGT